MLARSKTVNLAFSVKMDASIWLAFALSIDASFTANDIPQSRVFQVFLVRIQQL